MTYNRKMKFSLQHGYFQLVSFLSLDNKAKKEVFTATNLTETREQTDRNRKYYNKKTCGKSRFKGERIILVSFGLFIQKE